MNEILKKQLDFYRNRKAGCIFAAIVARNPKRYGWNHVILNEANHNEIDNIISKSIDSSSSTLSLLFPNVISNNEFLNFIQELSKSKYIILEQNIIYESMHCLGFRVKINDTLSWISGFGNFSFLPKTRQTPYTEIVFRIKPRPFYEWHMKAPIKNVIHLADMDMLGTSKRIFKKWWKDSLKNTRKVLGHSPNLLSAAKTTYSIPVELFNNG